MHALLPQRFFMARPEARSGAESYGFATRKSDARMRDFGARCSRTARAPRETMATVSWLTPAAAAISFFTSIGLSDF